MKKNVAVVGGTFDPVTIGHESIIRRAAELFDTVYVSICCNAEKKCLFTLDERICMLKTAFSDNDRIIPIIHNGLIAVLAEEKNAVIVKGLRYAADFDYEHLQSESNYMINGTETLFLASHSDDTFVTSSLIRELIKAKKPFEKYVSEGVYKNIELFLKNKTN